MVAPVFGAHFVPARVRLLLAGAMTLIVAPLVPPPQIATFSAAGVIVTIHQIIIGVATGVRAAAHLRCARDGRAVAVQHDGPRLRVQRRPAARREHAGARQLYMLLVTLTFLALNGHLVLIEMLAQEFHDVAGRHDRLRAAMVCGTWRRGAVSCSPARLTVALPGMTALLVVNLAFGVMSRAAPTLNLFAVGFPVTLIAGLVDRVCRTAVGAGELRRVAGGGVPTDFIAAWSAAMKSAYGPTGQLANRPDEKAGSHDCWCYSTLASSQSASWPASR